MKRKFTVYPQSIKASRRIYSDSNTSDFEITEDGVLVKYNGPGGDVVIPNSVNEIGDTAFCWCTSLTNIKMPDSITRIGDMAFYMCTSLTNIKMPDSVTKIGSSAFDGCASLTNIKIPDGVTSISVMTFSKCTNLTSIKIPNSVTKIGDYAFGGCTSLRNIKIPDSVTSIGKHAFEGCNKLPKDVKIYISQFYDDYEDGYNDDDEYDEISFAEWYDSSQGEADGMEFVSKLESLVRANYSVDEFFEEPSVQRYQGGDFIWITLSDGNKYEFEFDWHDEQFDIYVDGPEAAAKSYFQKIQDGIDSGSALIE